MSSVKHPPTREASSGSLKDGVSNLEVIYGTEDESLALFCGGICKCWGQSCRPSLEGQVVEYVKICSLYGAGFYYIPGTDTCIKLGGYLRGTAIVGSNGVWTPATGEVAGAHNRLSNYYTAQSRFDFGVDTRTATE
ncbi:porin [Bradyrhizobium sp. 182]|uniref:porin n=1 Tax=Bradyrhizobium sp. 182 TaxID=2782651 RepID=UPI0020983CE5|nr:porin [Bradyrhizobium sp. 182]